VPEGLSAGVNTKIAGGGPGQEQNVSLGIPDRPIETHTVHLQLSGSGIENTPHIIPGISQPEIDVPGARDKAAILL